MKKVLIPILMLLFQAGIAQYNSADYGTMDGNRGDRGNYNFDRGQTGQLTQDPRGDRIGRGRRGGVRFNGGVAVTNVAGVCSYGCASACSHNQVRTYKRWHPSGNFYWFISEEQVWTPGFWSYDYGCRRWIPGQWNWRIVSRERVYVNRGWCGTRW